MNKYNVGNRVYFINKKEMRIDYGIIRKIIIERDRITYDIELDLYTNAYLIEERFISENLDELYKQLRDDIEEYFPLNWG